MEPYASIEELVGAENAALATELNRLYEGDIEAVEAVPGFFLEKKKDLRLVSETMAELLQGSSLPGEPGLFSYHQHHNIPIITDSTPNKIPHS